MGARERLAAHFARGGEPGRRSFRRWRPRRNLSSNKPSHPLSVLRYRFSASFCASVIVGLRTYVLFCRRLPAAFCSNPPPLTCSASSPPSASSPSAPSSPPPSELPSPPSPTSPPSSSRRFLAQFRAMGEHGGTIFVQRRGVAAQLYCGGGFWRRNFGRPRWFSTQANGPLPVRLCCLMFAKP